MNKYVIITIKDKGKGMTKETMRHIFDPFFTTKETGRGLGLSSVLGIMRGHKGGISVNSVINEGTTLALLSPIGDQIPIPFPDVVSEISTTRVNRGVLVIDDEAPIREAIADILEWEELPVFLVSNGKDGIEIYRIHLDDIDLILLDLSMPGMGGEETFKALRG